jgi:phospholipid/cholesterol/gamma-HCH transport system substrate-binding protein
VAIAQYNPNTGGYVAPDGQVYRQSDLVTTTTPGAPRPAKTWKDMFAT